MLNLLNKELALPMLDEAEAVENPKRAKITKAKGEAVAPEEEEDRAEDLKDKAKPVRPLTRMLLTNKQPLPKFKTPRLLKQLNQLKPLLKPPKHKLLNPPNPNPPNLAKLLRRERRDKRKESKANRPSKANPSK